jgi:hypothetical protein
MNQRALLIQRQVASKANRTGHEFHARTLPLAPVERPGLACLGYVVFRFSSF